MTNEHHGVSRITVKMASLESTWHMYCTYQKEHCNSNVCTAAPQGCDARRRGSSSSSKGKWLQQWSLSCTALVLAGLSLFLSLFSLDLILSLCTIISQYLIPP